MIGSPLLVGFVKRGSSSVGELIFGEIVIFRSEAELEERGSGSLVLCARTELGEEVAVGFEAAIGVCVCGSELRRQARLKRRREVVDC